MLLPLLGCGPSVGPAVKPVLDPPPTPLAADCAAPVDLPNAAISAGQIERSWAQDRGALLDCGNRHHDAMTFYRGRDKALAGDQSPAPEAKP